MRITATEARGPDPHNVYPIYDMINKRLDEISNGDGFNSSIFVNSLTNEQIAQLRADGYKVEKVPMYDDFIKGTEYTVGW